MLAGAAMAATLLAGCEVFSGRQATPAPPVDVADVEPDGAANQETDERLAAAEEAHEAGQYDQALTMFRQILAENPTLTVAYLGIGEIHVDQQDFASAEPAFGRAARLEPRNFDAQFGHGLSLQMLDRLADAVRAYHRALSIRPNHPRANLNMATTYLQQNQPSSALVFAERAAEADPGNAAARVNLGAVYEQLGRYQDAATQYEAAVELSEPTPQVLMNLINVLARDKRYREAANAAAFLIRIEPSADAYERLGWAHFRLAEYDASIKAYREATKLDPSHWPALNGVGVNALNTWLLSGRANSDAAREARDAFRQSLKINPDQPRIVKLLSDYRL